MLPIGFMCLCWLLLLLQVLDEIMERFDSNRNGIIEYAEFVGTLFPVLGKGLHG
jgi:hypothetical protein